MSNLFSIFDPNILFASFYFPVNWLSALIIFFIFPSSFWLMKSQPLGLLKFLMNKLFLEIKAILPSPVLTGVGPLFAFFFMVLFSNFLGLFPYIFTSSSHLSFTVSLALPLWFGSVVWSWGVNPNRMFTHLVPMGTPNLLMPLMVMIETISQLIRPIALAVRLAANMVAGHLLLSLLGNQMNSIFSFVLMMLVLLMILECAVACIQAYVFTVLSTLYLSEL